jgi:hypothetical protein
MTVDLSSPHLKEALDRAGIPAPSADVIERLTFACHEIEGGADAVLEISQAEWATEEQGTDVLAVQTRGGLLLVGKGKRGRFKPMETFGIRAPFDYYQDVAEDDEMAGASVVFLPKDGHKPFLLSWRDADERRRMFQNIFQAHGGHYAKWGLQLDPANYVADFDRYYAQLVAEGPSQSSDVYDWVKARFGEFYLSNALGLAMDWRMCELDDATRDGSSRRVGRIALPLPWADEGPEAQRVIVRLGEQLFDAGLLGPPYDERTYKTDEPLTNGDAGPQRLLALMTLAGHAKRLGTPRADEWIGAARAGIAAVPPSVFSENMRSLWSSIDELPPDGPPVEIPIWEDVDVRAIATMQGDPPRPTYSTAGLTEADSVLVERFFNADQELSANGPPSGEAVANLCLLGVSAFEGLSADAPAGWRKLVLYAVSDLTYDLWEKHKLNDAATKLAHWVVATMEANGWAAQGHFTPLGQHYTYMFAVAVGTGAGVIQIDPATGLAKAPTGDEARRAAVRGQF